MKGLPVQNAWIGPWYERPDGHPFRYGGHETDAAGRFTLQDFMPGIRSGFSNNCVTGYTQMEDEGIAGTAGVVYPERVFTLDKLSGRIKAAVAFEDGSPIRNQSFFVSTFYSDGKKAVQLCRTDNEGNLACTVGKPGTEFTFRISPNGGGLDGGSETVLRMQSSDEVQDIGTFTFTTTESLPDATGG